MTAVAHVSFLGGGVFLPDHTGEDRQTLIDYIAQLMGSKEQVQILVEDQRWLAHASGDACAGCGFVTQVTCRETGSAADSYCLRCAFGPRTDRPAPPRRARVALEAARA